MMRCLHAGCGGERLPQDVFANFEEVRLDIDPQHKPDHVGSLTQMGEIGEYESAYCSHTLEHLYPHEVIIALQEFLRILKPGGRLMLVVPDLEDIKPTTDVVYVSPSGPVCGLDMYYGSSRLIPMNPYMAHHCGFTAETLRGALEISGFNVIDVKRSSFNLIAMAEKGKTP